MENLQVFKSNEFGELGILLIEGKEHFPATACAKVLGYARPNDAVHAHCRGTVKHSTPISGKMQEINYIPEGDLYRLIVRSKLPTAERFEHWVFDEVLPVIRKQGAYCGGTEHIQIPLIASIVSETVKQLIPFIINRANASPTTQTKIKPVTHKRRKHKDVGGIVESIDPALRKTVDEMLKEKEIYTYGDIANFLREHGITISGTSVQRYCFRMSEQAQICEKCE